jgi:hypothetical protein
MPGRPAAAARREYKQLFSEILALLKGLEWTWVFLNLTIKLFGWPPCYGAKT